jgi:hypothetical protein
MQAWKACERAPCLEKRRSNIKLIWKREAGADIVMPPPERALEAWASGRRGQDDTRDCREDI